MLSFIDIYLKMQMRTGTISARPHSCNLLPFCDLSSYRYFDTFQMSIDRIELLSLPKMFYNNDLSSLTFFLGKNHFSRSCSVNRSPLRTSNIYPLMRSKAKIPASEISPSPKHRIDLTITRQLIIFQIICFRDTRQFNLTDSSTLPTKSPFYLLNRIGPRSSK